MFRGVIFQGESKARRLGDGANAVGSPTGLMQRWRSLRSHCEINSWPHIGKIAVWRWIEKPGFRLANKRSGCKILLMREFEMFGGQAVCHRVQTGLSGPSRSDCRRDGRSLAQSVLVVRKKRVNLAKTHHVK